ncbi:hypothetical protein MBLNU230_g0999t1 [Neophaeotheca triangularis]
MATALRPSTAIAPAARPTISGADDAGGGAASSTSAIPRGGSAGSGEEGADDEGPPSKRRRVRRACDSCKSRKRKCNGEQPCPACLAGDFACKYDSKHGRGKSNQEGVMFAAAGTPASFFADDQAHNHVWPGVGHHTAGPVASGEQTNANTSRAGSPSGEGITPSGQFHGPSSTFSFLRRAWRRFGVAESVPAQQLDSREDSSIFMYGDRKPASIEDAKNLQLPDSSQTSLLAARYFDFAAPTYRFLHRPTFMTWLGQFHDRQKTGEPQILPIRQAIVLMTLATSCLYPLDKEQATSDQIINSDTLHAGEKYYQAAQLIIGGEAGKATLESVQARLSSTLYQLNTSRLNQAWYTLGTTFQLVVALGLHRRKAVANTRADNILLECQKRSFWAIYTLDTYLSVMLGRPPYINDTYVDQKYPEQVDDDDITADTIVRRNLLRDCIESAPVMHTQLMRIVKEASREQAHLSHAKDQQQVETARRLTTDVDHWKDRLPLFLSGGIHPSSLIPVFRRQLNVLQLACAHALMIINRPLILSQRAEPLAIQQHVEKCLSAARFVLDMVMDLVADRYMFPAFWYTQYVTFNALSMVYVWIMQRKRGRLSAVHSQYSEMELFQLAEKVGSHLARVTQSNAPTLRYSIILEELQREAHGVLMRSEPLATAENAAAGINTGVDGYAYSDAASVPIDHPSGDWNGVDLDFDPELWLQLDTLPFSNFDI